jgi:hypothetical protein
LKRLKKEDIERSAFVSSIMVGDCPNCGSENVHDCSKEEFILGSRSTREDAETVEGIKIAKDVVKVGSDCPMALKLDDPCIGHCDDCNYLWCLECGSELTMENPNCGHWGICCKCYEEHGYLGLDEVMEKICPRCEYWRDGCQLEDPSECEKTKPYECPYEANISECPTIREWSQES